MNLAAEFPVPESASQSKAMTLLDRALEGKDPEFQRQVLQWVVKTGVSEDDVLFLIMVAVGQLQFLLEQSPKDLGLLFEQWSEQLYDKLKDTERVAVKSQQAAISAAVRSLLQKTEWEQQRRWLTAVVPAAGLLLGAIGVGVLLGMAVPVWLQGGYGGSPRKLTVTEAEALQWAMGEEGKFARNLMRWNAGMLDSLDCLEEAKRLKVTLEVQGRAAQSGFCVLWVVPPSQRRF